MVYLPVFPRDYPTPNRNPTSCSHAVTPTSGCTRRCCRLQTTRIRSQHLPWSSSPLRRLSPGESTYLRFTSPDTFRPQGFSPSRRFTPRPDLPALFQTGNALGVRSSGAFPYCQLLRLITDNLPSWRFSSCPPRTIEQRRNLRIPWHPRSLSAPSGPLSSSRSVLQLQPKPKTATDPLLSFSPL
jgi:hypothetical protein